MPKMFFKESAVDVLLRLGDRLAEVAAERGVSQMTVGRGELRSLLNPGGGRSKDVLSMALRRFVLAERVSTPRWCLEILDRRKPLIVFRRVGCFDG
ncbi:MAG: hypothetical protein QXD32_05165 [Nitrososphaerota archaeon]